MKLTDIKGIIFDYGGTIDTNSVHWSEVLWEGFCSENIEITKEDFRECYVHGERTLAKLPLVRPEHNFLDLLRIKVDVETLYLVENDMWRNVSEQERVRAVESISTYCYNYVLTVLKNNRKVLETLHEKYPMVLVSNFYGNINTILKDFDLEFFNAVVESSVVGVRKPNPQIFELGVKEMDLPASNILVVGDSYGKDIVPANSIGCKTAWVKGVGWGDEIVDESVPSVILNSLAGVIDVLD